MFDNEALTRLLDAVAEPMRLQIVFLLCEEQRLNVGDIARQFRISRPAISHHLKVLKDAQVVQSEKVGQEIYYWANRTLIVAALRALADKIERSSGVAPSS